MKAYIMTTGAVFGLITLAHILRFAAEGRHLATEPVYVLLTIVAGSLFVWAGVLLMRSKRS